MVTKKEGVERKGFNKKGVRRDKGGGFFGAHKTGESDEGLILIRRGKDRKEEKRGWPSESNTIHKERWKQEKVNHDMEGEKVQTPLRVQVTRRKGARGN